MPIKTRLPHSVIVRAPGLLPMLYAPSELDHELQMPARTVRCWIDRGLPRQRDERGHIWIDGRQLAAWVEALREAARRSVQQLAEDEAFCVHCHRPVKLINPTHTPHGKHLLLRGQCPVCQNSIYRGVRHGQSAQLSTGA